MLLSILKSTVLFSIIIVLATACSDSSTTKKEVTPEIEPTVELPSSPLVEEYKTLKSQVDSCWLALEKVEEEKLFTLKRLIQEISYNPNHRSSRLKEEESKVINLSQNLITQASLSDLSNMDNYDVLSDQVIASVVSFKEETKGMESYPLADELVKDLDSLNGNTVISKRSEYGRAVQSYNKFIKLKTNELEKLGVSNLKPVSGLFPEE